MSQERTEWPTKARLEELRAQGIMPHSAFLPRAVAVIGVALCLAALKKDLQEFLQRYLDLLNTASGSIGPGALLDKVSELLTSASRLFFAPLAVAVILLALTNLIQNRFHLRFANLRFGAPGPAAGPPLSLGAAVWRIFSALLLGLLILALTLAFTWYYSPLAFSFLNASRGGVAPAALLLFKAAGYFFVPFLMGAAVLAWILSKVLFMHRHRVTKSQAQAEER